MKIFFGLTSYRKKIIPKYINGISTKYVKRTWCKEELGKRFIVVVSRKKYIFIFQFLGLKGLYLKI